MAGIRQKLLSCLGDINPLGQAFKQFYIIFDNEVQKKQIMQLLKEWEVEVTIDKKFAQQKEYERVVAEKTQMREERKKLYEESKKRKR